MDGMSFMIRWMLNKKFIIGFIIGIILVTTVNVYSFRVIKPPKLNYPLDVTQVAKLNQVIEGLWDVNTGRYTLEVITSVPTSTNANEGDIRVYYSGSTYRIYFFADGGWRYINADG